MKLGITSVLGETYRRQVNNAKITMTPGSAALNEVLPELKDCDLKILLANATLEETQIL